MPRKKTTKITPRAKPRKRKMPTKAERQARIRKLKEEGAKKKVSSRGMSDRKYQQAKLKKEGY